MKMQKLAAVVLVMFCFLAGCSDEPPLRATYTPGTCPPCAAADAGEQAQTRELTFELDDDEIDDEIEVAEVEGSAGEDLGEATSTNAVANSSAIDINTASALELTALPGVGPALAARIAEYRDKRPFEKAEDLQRVRGIGPAKFAKMRPRVAVE